MNFHSGVLLSVQRIPKLFNPLKAAAVGPVTRFLHTSTPLPCVPPNFDKPWADYYNPKIKIQKGKKTGTPRPKPHEFRPVEKSWNLREIPTTEEAQEKHDVLAPAVVDAVNTQLSAGEAGRLFAVIYVMGKQMLVKTEDVIVVEGYWPPQLGEVIRLEKVLMVGGRDFSLVGRPSLPQDQAFVEATVVEKTLAHTTVWFITKPRSNFRRWRFLRAPQTYLRINSVCVLNGVNELPEVEGVEGRVFGVEK